MAQIKLAMDLLKQVEHSNRDDKLLHKNKNENGLTFFGIYESAHPTWDGWNIIKRYLEYETNIKKCSVVLSRVSDLTLLVYSFYKKEFWDKMKLDFVSSQKIANEMFIFGVNVNWKIAAIKAQKLVGVSADGFVGNETLKALNSFDEKKFDIQFDEIEKSYYDAVIKSKPYLVENRAGWYNRADAV